MAVIENLLRNKLDKREQKATEKGLKRIDTAIEATGDTAEQASKQVKKANAAAVATAKPVEKAEKDKQDAIKKTTSVLAQQEAEFRATSEKFAAFGDFESGALGTAGIIGVAGGETGQQIEQTIRSLAEIPAAIENLPKMAQAIKGLGVRAVAAATGQTALATAETTTGAAAAGATTGLSAMLIPLGAIALIALPLAGALFLASKASKEATERAKELEEVYKAQAETAADIGAALQTGDVEGAISTYTGLLEEQTKAQILAANATERANKITVAEEEEFTGLSDIFNLTDLDKEAEESIKTQEEYADALAITDGQVEAAAAELRRFGVDVSNIPSAEATQKEKELASERERAVDAIQTLEAQEESLRANRSQALADQAQDRARRDSRENEDAAEAAKKRSDQAAKTAQESAKRLTEIRQDGVKAEAEALEKSQDTIVDTINDTNEKVATLNNDYTKSAIEAQNRFNVQRAQQQQQFANAQFDAVQNNDIIGALRAQRTAEQQSVQQKNDFRAEQAQRAAEKTERIAALKEEQRQRIAETQANLQIELAEQRKALREKLAAEAAAASERKTAEAKTAAEAEKSRQKKLRRQAEDDLLADERSQRAFEEQLDRIEKQKEAEQQALRATFKTIENGAKATINGIGQASQAVLNATAQTANAVIRGLVNNATQANRARQETARASGGRTPAGQMFRVNDAANRRTEFFRPDTSGRIIPLVDNLAGSSGGRSNAGGGNTVSIDLTVGDIATGEMVIQAIRGAARQTGIADVQVLADSLAGV